MRDKNPVIMGLIGALLLSTPCCGCHSRRLYGFSVGLVGPGPEPGRGKWTAERLRWKNQSHRPADPGPDGHHGQPAFGATATASLSGYEDVAPTDWYYEELAKAVQMGTFQGDNGALPANQPITREQAFAVLAGPLCWRRRTPTR